MSRISLMAALIALCMTVGCRAQTTSQGLTDPALVRHIEISVRSEFSLPPDYVVTVGARTPGNIPGYDKLSIVISRGQKNQTVDFLISTDNKTLARLQTTDLAKDPAFSIDLAGRPIRGNPAAKVTVINYDDLQCPYCSRMHESLFPSTLERYKDKVRFVYKDFPLSEIHPWAMHASVNANCLASQSSDVYWTYVDYIHSHGQEVSGENRDTAMSFAALDRIARQEATLAKLEPGKLDACLAKQDEASVRASASEATSLGIEGTPALFVNGERIPGFVPEEMVWTVIDRALRAANVEPPPSPGGPPHAAGTVK